MSHKAKTRIEIAAEYGISRRTLQRWLKKEKIEVSRGLIKPEELKRIYDKFGKPEKEKRNRFRDGG